VPKQTRKYHEPTPSHMMTPCPSCFTMWRALSVAFRWMSFVALINGLREQILWTLGFSCQYQTSHFDWTCSKCSCKIPQNFGPKSGLEISGIGSTLDILLFFRGDATCPFFYFWVEMPPIFGTCFDKRFILPCKHIFIYRQLWIFKSESSSISQDLFYHANIYSYICSYILQENHK
jgi:hypothetical protein